MALAFALFVALLAGNPANVSHVNASMHNTPTSCALTVNASGNGSLGNCARRPQPSDCPKPGNIEYDNPDAGFCDAGRWMAS
jgi:hypothetical protein